MRAADLDHKELLELAHRARGILKPFGMSQKDLADHLGCDVKVVNRIVNGRTSVTAEMALKLGAIF